MDLKMSAENLATPRQIVEAGLCIGCGSCAAQSSNPHVRMEWDRHGQLKPAAGDWQNIPLPSFNRTCPFAPGAIDEDAVASRIFPAAAYTDQNIGRFDAAYVGYVQEEQFRARGSSGGMVSWMAAELLRRGLADGVAHVSPAADPRKEGRFFRYGISRTVAELQAGCCSRYYPVELSSVLREIRTSPGRYAVVGLPCFIKAVHLLREEDDVFRERIVYTLGLFCGHMKSARFLDSIALQMGQNPKAVASAEFRVKMPDRPPNWYRSRITLADGSVYEKDWWHLADGDWGAGYFQNSACNFCDDVVAETADIAFGDAWVEPYASDPNGTNVVIVRNAELGRIIENASLEGRLELRGVDAGFVAETQAAGLRQRREGLAYRLAWRPPALRLRKRVEADHLKFRWKRKLIYRTRFGISGWSHRVFFIARRFAMPLLYVGWAEAALRLYQGLAYSRGRVGAFSDVLTKLTPRRYR